jgi:hypothetical protein
MTSRRGPHHAIVFLAASEAGFGGDTYPDAT